MDSFCYYKLKYMKKVKVAVIGTGQIGKHHARIFNSLRDANLVAVADIDEKTAGSLAQDYHCRFYRDFKKMIKEEKPDAVSIAVPNKFHYETAAYCIKKGINVMVEKPITQTLREAEKLIGLAKKYKVLLMVGHIERFNPAIQELKKRLEKGELGKIYRIDMQRLTPFPSRVRGAGVAIDLLVHDIDILSYLVNSKVMRIYAETAKIVNSQNEDLVSAILFLEDGIVVNINVDWLTPAKIRSMRVCGRRGMFVVDYARQDLFFYENISPKKGKMSGVIDGDMRKIKIENKEPLYLELSHFISCVKNGKKPLVTGEDGMGALVLVLRVLESANKKQAVKL